MLRRIFAIVSFLSITVMLGCGKSSDSTPDFNDWGRPTMAGLDADGKVKTHYVLDCRKKLASKVHYYYSIFADADAETTTTASDGTKTTLIPLAELSIDLYVAEPNSVSGKNIFFGPVDFTIITSPRGEKTYLAKAKADAEYYQKYYKKNPYFKDLERGDEILKVSEVNGRRTNVSTNALPGLDFNDALECR